MTETSTSPVLAALHDSQARLTAALDGLTADQVATQSYDDDWTVAQVASHLGSGAEVFAQYLDAGLTGSPAPGIESAQPIWDTWNAKDPVAQARDAVTANDAFLARLDALTDAERAAWSLDLFGQARDLEEFLRMRLSEHAIHTWDIEVSFDPTRTIPVGASSYVVAYLAPIAGWVGQKRDEPLAVEVTTSDPVQSYRLEIGPDGVGLAPSSGDAAGAAGAALSLPAESFVRLVYGRLDPDHTPDSVRASGVDLDLLRATFPGV